VKLAYIIPWFIRGLAVAVLMSAVAVQAEQTNFITALSQENKAAAGLTQLTDAQLAALNAQVQREISVAHQGNTVAFSTSFTHRRTPQQRKEAGLDQLMTPELKRLDELVAAAVAADTKPITTGPTIIRPASTTPTSPSDWVEVTPRKMEIHGEVTLAYMWGSGGRTGYGADIVTTMVDPSGKFAVTFAVSQFQFNGRGAHRPGEYACDRGW